MLGPQPTTHYDFHGQAPLRFSDSDFMSGGMLANPWVTAQNNNKEAEGK
jgi:hypothetical protein